MIIHYEKVYEQAHLLNEFGGYIMFYNSTSNSSVIDYTQVKYGWWNINVPWAVYIYNSSPTIKNSLITESKTDGV